MNLHRFVGEIGELDLCPRPALPLSCSVGSKILFNLQTNSLIQVYVCFRDPRRFLATLGIASGNTFNDSESGRVSTSVIKYISSFSIDYGNVKL